VEQARERVGRPPERGGERRSHLRVLRPTEE
jgi:hypothetical protein